MVIKELGKPLGNQTFAKCIWRLEMKLKRWITPKTTFKGRHFDDHGHTMRKNFICDSHPAICIVCGHIRTFLRYRKFPAKLSIMTKGGPYVWIRQKISTYFMKGEPNFTPLLNKHIVEHEQSVLRDDLVCLSYSCRTFYQRAFRDDVVKKMKFRLEIILPKA